jgi:pimeloyl-ACP methyl ester carboxylesterase
MKQFPAITLYFLFCFHLLSAQSVKTDKGKVNGAAFKYHYLEPLGNKKAIVILLPGSGEKCRDVLTKVSLARLLFDHGFVVIVPEVHTLLYADEFSIRILDELLRTKLKAYNTKKVILGGFSSGGAIATRYAEYLVSGNVDVDLKGLFVVDPPLDLQRVYGAGDRMLKNCNGLIKKEGANIKTQLENAFGGSPAQHPEEYISHSSFTANTRDGGNAKFLRNLPVRLYSEPDLDFVRKTYCDQLQEADINATDLDALHKFLVNAGNSQCEYITTKGRGFHSWNIIEPDNCLKWIMSIYTINLPGNKI